MIKRTQERKYWKNKFKLYCYSIIAMVKINGVNYLDSRKLNCIILVVHLSPRCAVGKLSGQVKNSTDNFKFSRNKKVRDDSRNIHLGLNIGLLCSIY